MTSIPPLVRRFDYRKIERVDGPSGRHYVCPDTGNPLPSVTTVLDKTADKTFLIEWKLRVGEVKAEAIKKEALGRGSLMHTHLENHMLQIDRPGGTNPIRKQASDMADVIIRRGFPSITEVWGMEVALHFPQLYAGTTDLVGTYRGRPAIMDYKTAKKIRTREQIEDYFCQGAAYSLAHNLHFGTDISTVVLFMVTPVMDFAEFVIEGSEFLRYADRWEERLLDFHGIPINRQPEIIGT